MKFERKHVGRSSWPLAGKVASAVCFLLLVFLTACNELEKPKTEVFYAQSVPPQKKEFRWSNGKMPKTFDPARASAPPETDIVRAVFEGLTDADPKTLEVVPAVAVEWKASEDFKTWTFTLRKDAKWSNGERVTAKDFVRSWKRLAVLGEQVAHPKLLENIVGLQTAEIEDQIIPDEENELLDDLPPGSFLKKTAGQNSNSNAQTDQNDNRNLNSNIGAVSDKDLKTKSPVPSKIGVRAADNFTLEVSLIKPDRNFPALVAHPVFRPIWGNGKDFEGEKLNAGIVTNGAFRLASVGQDGITLDRAEHFWGKDRIELERVRFIPKDSAEKALEAYRIGEIDALTNMAFEPLALKLLKPFEDFRQTTHSALNFYEFNRTKPPFDKVEVREALTIAIERERLTEDEMDGATRPAFSFLPFERDSGRKFAQDTEKARKLLAAAGFPNGENFPPVRIVINRNNMQQRIARAVAKMWTQNLNIKVEIVVKEPAEIEAVRESGDFDVLRRGVVLPTADETAAMWAIFAPQKKSAPDEKTNQPSSEKNVSAEDKTANNSSENSEQKTEPVDSRSTASNGPETVPEPEIILTEMEAMNEIPAIPLYFPTSYSLVKPYIQGFEMNALDAPSLKDVKIDNHWQPPKPKKES